MKRLGNQSLISYIFLGYVTHVNTVDKRAGLLYFLWFAFGNGLNLKRKNKYVWVGRKPGLVIAVDLEESENPGDGRL